MGIFKRFHSEDEDAPMAPPVPASPSYKPQTKRQKIRLWNTVSRDEQFDYEYTTFELTDDLLVVHTPLDGVATFERRNLFGFRVYEELAD
jgi:hypothetical protein